MLVLVVLLLVILGGGGCFSESKEIRERKMKMEEIRKLAVDEGRFSSS